MIPELTANDMTQISLASRVFFLFDGDMEKCDQAKQLLHTILGMTIWACEPAVTVAQLQAECWNLLRPELEKLISEVQT